MSLLKILKIQQNASISDSRLAILQLNMLQLRDC